jgi:hypothetical protein
MTFLKKGAFAFTMIALFFSFSCTKPTADIKVVVDANVIKYSAMINVTDANNSDVVPAGLTITVSGQDASSIYEISGKKDLVFADGIISLGPSPTRVPTDSDPVKFTITISAPGYNSISQNIQISASEIQQVVSVSLAKTSTDSPGGVTVTSAPPNTQTSQTTAVTMNFTGTCSNKSNFEFKPSNYIFYKVHGSAAAYQYLGYMDKGVITVQLQLGTTYDFKFVYDGQTYVITQDVTQTDYSETVNLGTTLCDTF